MTSTPIGHRLLLSLARRPMSVQMLCDSLGMEARPIGYALEDLYRAALVDAVPAGHQLRAGVVVSEGGFVGRVIQPCTVLGDGVAAGMWVRERKPLPSSSLDLAPWGQDLEVRASA